MTDAAREIQRSAYLQAMGVAQYVSRSNLPGAALSQRFARIPQEKPMPAQTTAGVTAIVESAQPTPRARTPARPTQADAASQPTLGVAIETFNVSAVQAGGWLWLEDLGDMPIANEQVQLVVAMATALVGKPVQHAVAQFGWPMHQNQQLDQGREAAAMSLGSFVERQLSDGQCSGIVLLGQSIATRLPETLACSTRVSLPGTRDMLENPLQKRIAWSALQPHAQR